LGVPPHFLWHRIFSCPEDASRSGNKKCAALPHGNRRFHAHKTAPFSAVIVEERAPKRRPARLRSEKGERSCFCFPIHRIGVRASTMIRVHCSAFTSRISRLGTPEEFPFNFIIAPQKITVNPYPWIYRNFSIRLQKTEHPFRHCGIPERVFCLDIALV